MNPFATIKYQLYLLQLENYELERFWKLLFAKGLWSKKNQRKNLVWTAKAKALLLMAIGLHVLVSILVGLFSNWILGLAVFLVLMFLYLILYTLSLVILWPFDFVAKQIIIQQAKNKIQKLSNLKVIGIAGSYGKTTMKHVLDIVLSQQFKVAATPESVNTPVGIARWILKNLNESTQIAIVEMGEHYKGDIAQLCQITPPDVAVITGINEAHMERMGNLENVAATIFEIAVGTKANGLVVLNGDNKHILSNSKKFVLPKQKLEYFKQENIKSKNFDVEQLQWEAELDGVGKINVKLLGEYALGDVEAAAIVGKYLGMPTDKMKIGIEKIAAVEHRLQPIKSAGNVLVIDDSYNGNPDGVREAVQVLSRFTDRRKIFITPGLVEMGEAAEEVHRGIGEELAGVADVVILVRNSVTKYIEEGIRQQATGNRPQVIWFETAPEAHENLKNILKPGDVILFQNDWGDQYL